MDHRIVWWYLIIINVITFLLYALDKYKAVHKKRRIREVTLLGFALIGGSAGALTAMLAFRHKTLQAQDQEGAFQGGRAGDAGGARDGDRGAAERGGVMGLLCSLSHENLMISVRYQQRYEPFTDPAGTVQGIVPPHRTCRWGGL